MTSRDDFGNRLAAIAETLLRGDSLASADSRWLAESILVPLHAAHIEAQWRRPGARRSVEARDEWLTMDYLIRQERGERTVAKVVAREWKITGGHEAVKKIVKRYRAGISKLKDELKAGSAPALVALYRARWLARGRNSK